MRLFHLIRNGALVDNQSYHINGRVVSNHRFPDGELILDPPPGRRTCPEHYEDEIWRDLFSVSREVNEALKDKERRRLVLFNDEEYEHNSDDDFFSISGADAQHFRLNTGNVIGFVSKGPYAVKISSRFGDDFLRYIIADTDGFLELDYQCGDKQGDGYEWLLAYLWNIKLKRAYRLGLPKSYVTRTEKVSRVRGKIDPIDYFQNKNSGTYRCSYREHSYATSAASLFAAAYEAVERYPFTHPSRSIYNSFIIANEGLKRSHMELLKVPHFTNPFYEDYNGLIDLSKRLISEQGADFGEDNDSNTFLFDVSMLFEYFIRKLLSRSGIQLNSKFEQLYKIPTGAFGGFRRKLEPDLVFEHAGGRYIFDVKYKSFDAFYGVSREDLFQLHTYLGQHANSCEVKGCGFIYPMSEEKWTAHGLDSSSGIITDVIHQQGKDVPFHVLFLRIPPDGRGGYNRTMQLQCDGFIRGFQKTVLKKNESADEA